MSKKNWAREIEVIHERILEFLRLNEHADITQTDYTRDLFKIFLDAYERGFCAPLRYRAHRDTGCYEWIQRKPHVSGSTIWSYALKQAWVVEEMSCEEQRYRDIDLVMTWWDAWTYALRAIGYKTSFYRWVGGDPH